MMKLKMLLAFVLVAGFGCVAEVSARAVQRRVGKPVPTGYKARLERIQSSGGFNARRGVRGGEFAAREGIHPQELELKMLQGQELDEDQQAELREFHAANPGIAEQFNEAMLNEGFEAEAFQAVMPTQEAEGEEGEEAGTTTTTTTSEEKKAIDESLAKASESKVEEAVAKSEEPEEVTVSDAQKALADAKATLQELKTTLASASWFSPFANQKTKLLIEKQQETVNALERALQDPKKEEGVATPGMVANVTAAVYQTVKSKKFLAAVGVAVAVAVGYDRRDTQAMQKALSGLSSVANYMKSTRVCSYATSACSLPGKALNWALRRTPTEGAVDPNSFEGFATGITLGGGYSQDVTGQVATSVVSVGNVLGSYRSVLEQSAEKALEVSQIIAEQAVAALGSEAA